MCIKRCGQFVDILGYPHIHGLVILILFKEYENFALSSMGNGPDYLCVLCTPLREILATSLLGRK